MNSNRPLSCAEKPRLFTGHSIYFHYNFNLYIIEYSEVASSVCWHWRKEGGERRYLSFFLFDLFTFREVKVTRAREVQIRATNQ